MAPDDLLDLTLLDFTEEDSFTIRDSFDGVQIFGGIGSGKTSGSGASFAQAYLTSGYGGLVLTAKVDETQLWKKYAAQTGRSKDLIIVSPDGPYRFNFLQYEQSVHGEGGGLTENLVDLFSTVAKLSTSGDGAGGSNEQFWAAEFSKLVRNAVALVQFAREALTLQNIYRVILGGPQNVEEVGSSEWQLNSYCYRCINKALDREEAGEFNSNDLNDLRVTLEFWNREFPAQAEKTRGTVISMFTGLGDVFMRGFLREIFGTTTNFSPEDCFAGKIIVLDFPVKRLNEMGILAQKVFKFCWQRAVERRSIQIHPLPVFLWIDESQHFVNKHDVAFQTTARSARVATVLLTQNIPNYQAFMDGARGEALVKSLLGNLSTKIFHNNTCITTNTYGADLIGKDWQTKTSRGYSGKDSEFTHSSSESNHMEYLVLPRSFSGLATGGPENDSMVEAIIFQAGRVFNASNMNAIRVGFLQSS